MLSYAPDPNLPPACSACSTTSSQRRLAFGAKMSRSRWLEAEMTAVIRLGSRLQDLQDGWS